MSPSSDVLLSSGYALEVSLLLLQISGPWVPAVASPQLYRVQLGLIAVGLRPMAVPVNPRHCAGLGNVLTCALSC